MEKKVRNETIVVCSAHSDDFVIGAGGTIANYTSDGKKVIVFVFSYGEKSHPWLKKDIVQKMRSDEAFEASKILQCKTIFFDLREFHFLDDYEKIEEKMVHLMKEARPSKIFTHSLEDPHPDHKAVHTITLDVFSKLKENKPELYTYSVWNPVSFKTTFPALYVDITKTFGRKLKSLKTFRSQKIHIIYPFFLLLLRAIKEGFKIKKRFGEKFFRIR